MGYELQFGVVLTGRYLELLQKGLITTLELFALCWIFAFALALLLTFIRAMPFRPVQWLVETYVEYHRNVPLLVQLFVWYFGVPNLLPRAWNVAINSYNAEMAFAIIALSFFSAAYMSEDFRSGLRSIPGAQRETALAQGFTFIGTMRWVLLPQAARICLPGLVNQTLQLFKATSLAGVIGVAELTYQARDIEDKTFRVFEAFGVVTIIYLAISFSIMAAGALLAKRYRLRT
jgi:polar amino acid transport system permease protein